MVPGAISLNPMAILAALRCSSRCCSLPHRRMAARDRILRTTTSTTKREVTPIFRPRSHSQDRGARSGSQRDLQRPRGPLRQSQRHHPVHVVGLRSRPVPVQLPGGTDHRLRQLRRQPELPARHRADLRSRTQPANRRRSAGLHRRRSLNIPINIPVAVRTGSDYGLRFTVSNITQLTPLAGANLTFWGFPAERSHDAERFPKGAPGEPANCPDSTDTSCIGTPTPVEHPVQPIHRQSDDLHREPLVTTPRSPDLPGPRTPSRRNRRAIRRRPTAIWRSSTRFSTQAPRPPKPTRPRA